MIYLPFDYTKYNSYSFYGDKIIFLKSSSYIQSNYNTTSYTYVIYHLNTQQFAEFNSEYLPYEFISMAHLENIRFYPVYNSDYSSISYWYTQGNPNPTYHTIYLSRDFSQFTNNIFYAPNFPLIFICGFINLLIVLFIINNLTRIIKKGGILFSS